MTPASRFTIPLLLIVAGAAAYADSLSGPFILDDLGCIVMNAHLRGLWPLHDLIRSPEPASTVDGRPLLSLSLGLNYAFGRLEVMGYHVVNVLIHLGAGLLLYGVVRRTLLLPPLSGRYGTVAPWLAGSAALLWLLHPLHTPAVSYVIQRAESLMALCYLLALYGLVRGHALTAVLACAAGMLAKEVMVTAPVALLLYDRCFLSGSFREAWRSRRRLYLALAATWLVLAACLLGGSRFAGAGEAISGVGPWTYALTECGVILHYVRLCVWPSGLVFDYGWPMARAFPFGAASALLALLAVTLLAFWKTPRLGFPAAWFFLVLSPTSSFVPSPDPAVEYRLYLPLAGLVVLAVIGGHALLSRRPTLGLLAVLAAALALGTLTHRRNRLYRDPVLLWTDTVAKRPLHARAHRNLGKSLAAKGDLDGAIAHLERAQALNPRDQGVPGVLERLRQRRARRPLQSP